MVLWSEILCIIVKKLHLQKYKFVDFLYTNMKNFIQNPDYRKVLTFTGARRFYPTTFLEIPVENLT